MQKKTELRDLTIAWIRKKPSGEKFTYRDAFD